MKALLASALPLGQTFLAEVRQNARRVEALVLEGRRQQPAHRPQMPSFPIEPGEEVRLMKASRSWRYTAPLRSVADAARRNRLLAALAWGARRTVRLLTRRGG